MARCQTRTASSEQKPLASARFGGLLRANAPHMPSTISCSLMLPSAKMRRLRRTLSETHEKSSSRWEGHRPLHPLTGLRSLKMRGSQTCVSRDPC